MKSNLIIHPGLYLKEDVIEANQLSVTKAAELLGVTRVNLSNILNEKTSISASMAIRISQVFGGTADIWLKLQMQYDLLVAQNKFEENKIHLAKYEPAL
ncbi:HigA family addiction module antidote protein [Myroides sp. 1354]|uniref:HigA family addiction module antitoxin n=1 Tax=unclassified Myroides TaxID=2642485 RepID=UPI00257584D6|nr:MULTISPECIES: HigA family addiction module antitoxin [unclassified Myroides]MDM1045222.1 HigA family addiction module antidote protein [Myroides sp. R163-1]MDM1056104.1 HigA family addiction module antidote protein [Myroides sp. 1354]MDM1069233.1 HigA family addiction module antidote protein [Myroides sp. 1372]